MSGSSVERSVANAGCFQSWAASHPGLKRGHNEDRFLNRPDLGLWAVADGAGGHKAGQIASSTVIDALQAVAPGLAAQEALADVRLRITQAHAALREEAARRGDLVATTVVVLLVRDEHFACLWAGDSRAYLLRDGHLAQITRDHSLVQSLVDAGAISAEAAERHPHANVITRAVGTEVEEVELDKIIGTLAPGDRLLLCTDGLSKALAEAEIAAVLAAKEDSPAERLLLAALARVAGDNVTAVAVEMR